MGVLAFFQTLSSNLRLCEISSRDQVQPRKLRQSLDTLLDGLKALPNRLRQYAACDHLQSLLRGYLKANALVCGLFVLAAIKAGTQIHTLSMGHLRWWS